MLETNYLPRLRDEGLVCHVTKRDNGGGEGECGHLGGSLLGFSPGEHQEDSEKWKQDGLIHYGIQCHLMPGLVSDDHEHPQSHHSNWQRRNIPAACRTHGGQQVAELRPQIPGVEGSSAEGRIPESGGSRAPAPSDSGLEALTVEEGLMSPPQGRARLWCPGPRGSSPGRRALSPTWEQKPVEGTNGRRWVQCKYFLSEPGFPQLYKTALSCPQKVSPTPTCHPWDAPLLPVCSTAPPVLLRSSNAKTQGRTVGNRKLMSTPPRSPCLHPHPDPKPGSPTETHNLLLVLSLA